MRTAWVCASSVRRFRLAMTRSASGTYSLPSACMKSYWVSTSQKMTRAMAGNLSEDTGACQREDLGQGVRPRLGKQRRDQGAPDARPLPILPHGERGELRQVAGVHLERPAADDLVRRRLGDYVLLDVAAEIVVRTWQQVAALDVRSHQGFELRHVSEHRTPQCHDRERGAGSGDQSALLPVNG